MLQSLLSYDEHLLILARNLVDWNYATIIQWLGELIVIWCMLFLVFLWIYSICSKIPEYKYIALRIFFTIIFVFAFYLIINFGIPKWRANPQEIAGSIAPLIPHPIDNSFPSGHALFSGAFLIGLLRFFPNWKIILITSIIALITVVSRVIGWVHYPWDILGWLIVGTIGWILVSYIVRLSFMEEKVYPMIVRILSWIKL
jgi:membrane-associated phospholipid phosphatase